MTRRKKIVFALLTLLLAAGVTLAAAEILIRVFAPQPVVLISEGLYGPDPPGRYHLTPGYRGTLSNRVEFHTRLVINRQGLRGDEISPRRPGTWRVLVLGDSFTFGYGVEQEETYAARLERALAASGVEVEVLNGGVPGFGLPDAVSWLERHGAPLEPDLVLLGIFTGNDLTDAMEEGRDVRIVHGRVAGADEVQGLRWWLYHHSHLFAFAKSALPASVQAVARRLLGLDEPASTRRMRLEMLPFREPAPPRVVEALATTRDDLARLRRLARERGFRLAAVLIPDLIQLDDEPWRARLDLLGLDPAAHDPRRPTRLFLELLAERDIPALDLTPAFERHRAAGEVLYFSHDRHWNAAGHALAAEELRDWLLARGPWGTGGEEKGAGRSAAGPP